MVDTASGLFIIFAGAVSICLGLSLLTPKRQEYAPEPPMIFHGVTWPEHAKEIMPADHFENMMLNPGKQFGPYLRTLKNGSQQAEYFILKTDEHVDVFWQPIKGAGKQKGVPL